MWKVTIVICLNDGDIITGWKCKIVTLLYIIIGYLKSLRKYSFSTFQEVIILFRLFELQFIKLYSLIITSKNTWEWCQTQLFSRNHDLFFVALQYFYIYIYDNLHITFLGGQNFKYVYCLVLCARLSAFNWFILFCWF